ncbi:MAG: hypothetical protein AB1646_13825 [Thermodesulfobacteriota bacterium]
MEVLYRTFLLGLGLTALDYYSVLGIPLPWLGSSLIIFGLFVACFLVRVSLPPHLPLIAVLICWAFFITVLNFSEDYEQLMPAKATTRYTIFVSLRFVELLTFVCTLVTVYTLCTRGYYKRFVRSIALMGTVLAIAAVYLYLAQLYGLPEPPRTRLGTSGDMIFTPEYSYAFHRASGTFREPSIFSVWMVLPFFLSAAVTKKVFNVHSVLILSALMLTGSMNFVLAIGTGLLVALLVREPWRAENLKNILAIPLLLAGGWVVFRLVAQSYDHSQFSLLDTIVTRLTPLIEEGPEGTNRAFVYEFLRSDPPPLLGYGLGNANLVLAQAIGATATPIFANLLICAVYSTGVPGLLLTMAVVLAPIKDALAGTNRLLRTQFRWLIGAYAGFCVTFFGHEDSFGIMFGITYALVAFSLSDVKAAGRAPVARSAGNGSREVGSALPAGPAGSVR